MLPINSSWVMEVQGGFIFSCDSSTYQEKESFINKSKEKYTAECAVDVHMSEFPWWLHTRYFSTFSAI